MCIRDSINTNEHTEYATSHRKKCTKHQMFTFGQYKERKTQPFSVRNTAHKVGERNARCTRHEMKKQQTLIAMIYTRRLFYYKTYGTNDAFSSLAFGQVLVETRKAYVIKENRGECVVEKRRQRGSNSKHTAILL